MTTHHSEFLKLESVFIKPAKNAFVSDQLLEKQWRDLNYLSQPYFRQANEEYNLFETTLKNAAVQIHHFPKDESLSIDSIYCRDAAIATDFGMILCNMGKPGRVKEPTAQKQVYLDNSIPVLGEITAPGTLEGGDVAWLDEKTLAVGHTYRTNEAGIAQLKALLEPKGIEIIVAELPHYKGKSDVFHLMSILSPVAKDLAVVYSPLMPIKFRNELLNRGFQLVEVPEAEFDSMGCNVLAIAPRKCIMVAGNPVTQKALEAAGCEVIAYEGEHISVKGGGGPTCLTRPMLRSF
ncbi:N-dimethylarginine dimethylaminohydrolase [Ulvibacter sp. MAR_2010_11]|uniref:dimethylarginine dimethylaminohydrolase family protein n=1 Tax=Ulvibacter sp. MAR_2010_11 TaxID=1250229 RepID=UPI000C2BC3D2|nr:arginine deiminase family protein [Ulvibacter sp. MAR_2010_11]PKA82641.1 N-dimethylarginine dimethylaminohydrolase [Ulvibacter sp. MAR_2010_11]